MCKWAWNSDDTDVSWVSLFYEPTVEEMRKGWEEDPSDIRTIFEGFLKACIPNGSRAYGVLVTPSDGEYQNMIEYIRERGLKLITRDEFRAKRSILRRLFEDKDPGYVFVGDASSEHISNWYKSYFGWQINPYHFLVSSRVLDDWPDKLLHLRRYKMSKQFLATVDGYLQNHWEHGIEFISLESKFEAVHLTATALADKLGVPLEVREKGSVS